MNGAFGGTMRRTTLLGLMLGLSAACGDEGGDDASASSTSIGTAATASTTGASTTATSGDSASASGTAPTTATGATSGSATTGGSATTSGTASTTAGTSTTGGTGGGGALTGCFHSWTFEGCPGEWETGKANAAAVGDPSWECGDPPNAMSLDGAHVGVWATGLAGDYNDDESSYLMSPSFSLADCAGATVYLTLAHLFDFGSTDSDGGIVQISTDGGAQWTTVEPSWNGYCAGTLTSPYAPPAGEAGFCNGDDELWMHSLIPIGTFGGQTDVRVRMVFGSDGILNQEGWYIDSVGVEAYQ